MRSISNSDSRIDSRDIISRIEDLESEIECAEEGEDLTDVKDELAILTSVKEEGENYASDWNYGATLIKESDFENYAEEFAQDIGAFDSGGSWPLNCIDWAEAADQLKVDYTEIDFDGETYLVRS